MKRYDVENPERYTLPPEEPKEEVVEKVERAANYDDASQSDKRYFATKKRLPGMLRHGYIGRRRVKMPIDEAIK